MTSFRLLKLLEELARDIPLEDLQQHMNDVTNMADSVLRQVLLPLASLALGGSRFRTGLVGVRASSALARVTQGRRAAVLAHRRRGWRERVGGVDRVAVGVQGRHLVEVVASLRTVATHRLHLAVALKKHNKKYK